MRTFVGSALRSALLVCGIGTDVAWGAAVQQAWAVRYDGPAGENDGATAIAVDQKGNVFVTGPSTGVGTMEDFATLKLNAAGATVWERRYDRAFNHDTPAALAVDVLGNVYVTGNSYGGAVFSNIVTIKYDTNGNEQWLAQYNAVVGGISTLDIARALAVDASGNVYVAGDTDGYGTNPDCLTIKYASVGRQLWTVRYDGPAHGSDRLHALAVDAAGNVYVGGAVGTMAGWDALLIKYGPTGNQLWLATYNSPGNVDDCVFAIALDHAGNPHVAVGYDGYTTIKYDANGTRLWTAKYAYPGAGAGEPSKLAVDAGGNVYVTGTSVALGTAWDLATVKYSPAGAELWVKRHAAAGATNDGGVGLALDQLRNVYVAAYAQDGADTNYLAIKYDTNGTELWRARYDGPAHANDDAAALALDCAGNVYVTGASVGTTTPVWSTDFATVKLVPTTSFRRGDANCDKTFTLADAITTLSYLFNQTPVACMDALDANDSGSVDLGDAVYLLFYLFAKGAPPPPPYPGLGTDSTFDCLGCAKQCGS